MKKGNEKREKTWREIEREEMKDANNRKERKEVKEKNMKE